jgi:hypothetical protein
MSKVEQHLRASQEEHQEEAVEGEVVQNEWIELPQDTMADVYEGEQTKEALDQLADKVDAGDDKVVDQVALENFNWTFKTLTRLTNLTPKTFPALEDYTHDAPLQRKVLSGAIRAHSDRLARAINFGLEDYTESFGNNLQQLVESMKSSQADLNRSLGRINGLPSKTVKVNHAKIWAMLHVNGRFVKDLDGAITDEQRHLRELLTVAKNAAAEVAKMAKETEAPSAEGVEAAMNRGGDVELMFNTSVSFSGGQVDFQRNSPPSPKTEKVGSDYLRGAAWGTLFGFLLLGPAFLLGTVIGAVGSSATGSTSASKRDVDGVKSFLQDLGGFAKLAADIESIAESLNDSVKASTAHGAVVKRAAAPVMELMSGIAKHVAELCYGGANMASALSTASK